MAGQRVQAKAKFYDFMGSLDIKHAEARGLLQLMWDKAQDDGNPFFKSAGKVAKACFWRGDPDELVHALVENDFLDEIEGGYVIHDWWEHIPYNAKKKSAAIVWALQNGVELEKGLLRWAASNMPVVRDTLDDLGIDVDHSGAPVKKADKKRKEELIETVGKSPYSVEFEKFWAGYRETIQPLNAGTKNAAWQAWQKSSHEREGRAEQLMETLLKQIQGGLFSHKSEPKMDWADHASTWLNTKGKKRNWTTEVELVSEYDSTYKPRNKVEEAALKEIARREKEDAAHVEDDEVPAI